MKALFPILLLILFQAQLFAANGDDSLHAIPAKEGMNITPRTPCWFSYTLTEPDKKLIISSDGYTSENTCLIVYDSCNGNIIAQNDDYNYTSYSYSHYSNQSYVAISGLAPTTIYIYWGDEHSTMYFNWELRVEEDIELINCRNAVPAVEGANNDSAANKWYYFTMPEANKKLVISSYCDPAYEDFGLFFYHSCDSEYFDLASRSNGYVRKEIFDLDSNETVFFRWSGFSSYNCDYLFDLSVEDIEPGDIAALPLPAVEGTDTITVYDQLWYSYTMPLHNQRLIIQTPFSWNGHAISTVYDENYNELVGLNQNVCFKCPYHIVYDAIDSGQTVYILWSNNSYYSQPFTWTFSVEDIQPGDLCSIPIQAIEGTNIPTQSVCWYSYTMPEANKKIVLDSVISIPGYANPGPACGMSVFDACNGNTIPLSWFNDKYYLADLEPGQTIYLKFGCVFYWKLELEDRVTGDRCSDPIIIGEGEHNIPSIPTWYAFTMPEKNKQLIISTPYIDNSPAKFDVYDSCSGNILRQEQIIIDTFCISRISGIDSGQTVIIRGQYPSIYSGLSWYISSEDEPDIVIPNVVNITLDKGEIGSCDVMIGNEGGSDLHVTITPESSTKMGNIIIPDTSLLSPENAITICLWLYLSSQYDSVDCDAGDNWRIVLAKNLAFLGNGGYDIILEEDRTLTWDVGTVGGLMRYRSNEVIPYNEWTHLTFTYDAVNGIAAIYINGDKVGGSYLSEGDGKMLGNTTYLTLDYSTYNSCNNGYGHFSGNYDEFSIWNKIRPLEDIRKDLDQPKIDFLEDGLIGYWGFENGKNPDGNWDGKVHDYSPNHIDGYGNYDLFDSPFSFFDISPQSLTIPYGASESINLLFEPGERDTGVYEAKLAIRSDDPDESFKIIPVKMRIADLLTIRGYVRTQEGVGIRGVILSGLPGNPVTDSRGYFSMIINSGWNGTITPFHEMYNFSPPSIEISNINSDQVYEFIAILKALTINGFVQTNEGHGVQGVLLFGLPGNPVTGSNGYYSATVNYGWNGKVIPMHSEYSFEPSYRDYINITADQDDNYVGTSSTIVSEYADNPLRLSVYPNPFSDNTIFRYYLPEAAEVHLIVYDIRGMIIQTLVNDSQEAGSYTFTWDGSGAENGIYYYKLSVSSSVSNGKNETIYGKLVLIRE